MQTAEDALLRQMADQVTAWQTADDGRWIFLGCYRMMTGSMLHAAPAGAFSDQAWVERLLRHFAAYYFDALRQYDQSPAAAPPVWREAHDAARDRQINPLQKLLLGVNAHINYDLVLALHDVLQPEWATLDETTRRTRHADHRRVNRIIGQTVDAVQDEILTPLMPGLGWVDKLLGSLDERLLSSLISGWREDVWDHARQLLALPHEVDRRAHIQIVETRTLAIAHRIAR